jgi:hypothetical protein
VPLNGSLDIVKLDTPFWVKAVVTPVVVWSGGSHISEYSCRQSLEKGPMVFTC